MLMEKTANRKMNEDHMQPKLRQENDVRIAILETSMGHINQTLERIERNIESGFREVNKRIDNLDDKLSKRIDRLEEKMNKVNGRSWTNFYWTLTVISTFSLGLLATMAKGFHWIGG